MSYALLGKLSVILFSFFVVWGGYTTFLTKDKELEFSFAFVSTVDTKNKKFVKYGPWIGLVIVIIMWFYILPPLPT